MIRSLSALRFMTGRAGSDRNRMKATLGRKPQHLFGRIREQQNESVGCNRLLPRQYHCFRPVFGSWWISEQELVFRTIGKRRREKSTMAAEVICDQQEYYGPLGRPALTESLLNGLSSEEDQDLLERSGLLGKRMQSKSPKLLLNQAGVRLGFELPQYRYEKVVLVTEENSPEKKKNVQPHPKQQKVTAVTVFPNPNSGANYYETLRGHPHVGSHPDFDWIEIVAVGIAATRQRAGQLAAFDQIRLWKEATGVDLTLPPEFWAADEEAATAIALGDESEIIDTDDLEISHSRSQAIMELLRCSPILYDFDHHEHSYWTADAETYWKGNYYFSDGMQPQRTKKEAKKQALVALLEQNRDTPLGKAAEFYESLLEDYPRLAILRIPPWKDGLAKALESSLNASGEILEGHPEDRNNIASFHGHEDDEPPRSKKRAMTTAASAAISAALKQRDQARLHNIDPQTVRSIEEARRNLPIANLRSDLREALESSNIILVEAGTGSGKSTQIPQYILEDALAADKGATTRILVTQPRRLAAKSLAERVSYERFESKGNGSSSRKISKKNSERSVGYSVRFESLKPRDEGGTIEFVTTGILLRRLVHDENALEGISHVLIDEVHERDLNADLLLVLMREYLVRKQQTRSPKLLLLSATLEANPLMEYFAPAAAITAQKGKSQNKSDSPIPVLSLPTKPLHPVKTWFLEDLLSSTKNSQLGGEFSSRLGDLASVLLRHNESVLRQELSDLQPEANKPDRVEVLEKAVSILDSYGPSTLSPKDNDISFPLRPNDLICAAMDLVSELVLHLSKIETIKDNKRNKGGSILCFLPGMDEIKVCMDYIDEDCPVELRSKLTILPLHSSIPHEEQAKVFSPAKAGHIKVILATNIAESSLTIDDVLAVIDSGLVKDAVFDATSAMTTLETQWASKASVTQRLGRVGRVAPGNCYRLFSRADFHAMDEKATPEIQKTCLEGTYLQACSLLAGKQQLQNFGSVKNFLASSMDPPSRDSVETAMKKLTAIGAICPFNSDRIELERLTILGECLVKLPLDPSIGRMLVLGTLMKCLSPLLTAAAWFSGNQMVFSSSNPEQRAKTRGFQRSFSENSDVAGVVHAYDEFWEVQRRQGWKAAKAWARENCINSSAFFNMRATRKQLLSYLAGLGLVDPKDITRGDLRRSATVNQHSDCKLLLGALWCTALPQNLASRNRFGHFGTLTTAFEEDARLHPSSVLFHRKPPPKEDGLTGEAIVLPEWYSYRQKVQTSDLFLQGCSSVLPEQILLFGGSHLDTTAIAASSDRKLCGVLDGWIAIESGLGDEDETTHLLLRARRMIEATIERKLLNLFKKSSQWSKNQDSENESCDTVIDGIRTFFDDLENDRIPKPEPRRPSSDFHDYFLEKNEAD